MLSDTSRSTGFFPLYPQQSSLVFVMFSSTSGKGLNQGVDFLLVLRQGLGVSEVGYQGHIICILKKCHCFTVAGNGICVGSEKNG